VGITAPQIGPSAASVRAALEKILASPGFAGSERLARFLRYAVEETLEGRSDALKETTVGVDVFGRKPGYDPRLDGVVRTEAIKLRAKLKEYYEDAGSAAPVRIDLPKGGYVPVFSGQRPSGPIREHTVPGRWIVLGMLVFSGTIVAIAATWLFSRPRSEAPPPSIAVLPFLDMSAEKNQQYLCDGMTEQIIDALSRISGFQVVARSSVFALKGNPQDVREIGRRLNVRSVLEGSVQRSGSRVRVTAQLINASDGFHLWSQSYDREMSDIFALEDDISRAIVNTLEIKLAKPLAPAPQADLEAYNLYLQGRYWYFKWRPPEVLRAVEFFQNAIKRDPDYALAYAGLADAYSWLGFFRMPAQEVMPKARAAAERAIALDPKLDSAHVALAEIKAIYDYDGAGAQREFARAIEVNPACSNAMFSHSLLYLAPRGRTTEAIDEMKHALELDPLNVVFSTYLATLYFFDRQNEVAIDQLRKTLTLAPDFREAKAMLFHAYITTGKTANAQTELEQLKAMAGDTTQDENDALLLAAQGRKDAAREILTAVNHQAAKSGPKLVTAASVYVRIDERDRALEALEQAYQRRDGMLAFINVWPELAPLKSDPRFQALLGKLNLLP
jgi:TolB-like protein/Tfp pilus assembly protein PilF